MKHAVEANFDGLVGPTHNYAGLSWGNVASKSNVDSVSNPREAALQGLAKMKRLADRGYVQGILPPHERPHLPTLRALGFDGSDARVLEQVVKANPSLLAAASSASAMWTANAATVSPSADTADHRVHFTPANLSAKFHRSIEHRVTGRALKSIFGDEGYFAHHPALPSVAQFGDEGAANHTRLCNAYGASGVELFVYGQVAFNEQAAAPSKYPARQTLEASQAIARLHGLSDAHCVFAQQNPKAIDAGVFHNDVIAVGNGNALFYHEMAFLDEEQVLSDIRARLTGAELEAVRVSGDEVPIEDAVASYLFNSQLLNTPDGMMLAVPGECREIASVSRYLDELIQAGGPITSVEVFDVKQSMRNGGGPACLRLRVVLNDDELAAMHRGVLMDDALYERLTTWVEAHYRDRLSQSDLADPMLLEEVRKALDELTGILGLGSIYDFQL
ncbi:MAG: N-succinylarginine dihydrolase [Gammaproteobacteria bacterium]|uniref:N-succinylarginine dihydrolase n=1 Tax=Marinobacter nitratireducens TaxID=1137280 RepID=A0A072N000_9GAMM|nr:N-succinylarginine dihydrolase [Marinobacter nitratireducens]KEF30557.1 Succinylarginine dihydrolase [Marinobacter nitratireducens]TNE71244.1 MAG: N-succinylarginine dihydrolase [Gammaproteobacteria bacterium]TNE94883.1 MAG: N-succinylarginine dihydrolase [Gammaproteobacteria bacterium]